MYLHVRHIFILNRFLNDAKTQRHELTKLTHVNVQDYVSSNGIAVFFQILRRFNFKMWQVGQCTHIGLVVLNIAWVRIYCLFANAELP